MNFLIPNSLFSARFFNDPSDLLFKDLFDSDGIFDTFFEKTLNYPVDVKITRKGLEFDVAAIGLEKNDIKIEIKEGDIMAISYDKKKPVSGCEVEDFLYKGITSKSFSMAWKISPKFDLSKLDAKLEKGLLKIIIPLNPEKAPKFVEIKD